MRRAGILLHPTSLPSRGPVGDLGPAAHAFVDWLADAGCTLWQILPLNPTGPGWCPYASPSALAAEPRLLSVEALVADGLLKAHEVPPAPTAGPHLSDEACERWTRPLLNLAADRYAIEFAEELAAWASTQPWAEDWALFAAVSEEAQSGWWSWPDRALADRDPAAMAAARARLAPSVRRHLALQALFDKQWAALRAHAESRGVSIVGDIPIFVSGDGCDTWTQRELFRLDAEGKPEVVTGVPPDYFSKTGQLWGNPHYDWAAHAAEGYDWWRQRLSRVLQHTHIVRIDHFRGFSAAWAVDRDAEDAIGGHWEPGPGEALFRALGDVPIIAEDLGVITPDVEALRDNIGAPGMKVLQFAFGGDADHVFLPHNYASPNCVAYTGTHDNDTARGWYESTDERARHRFRVYASADGSDAPWDLIRLAWASIADSAIAPLQDALNLGAEARMNVPGLAEGNWTWRVQHIPDWVAPRLRGLAWSYGRLPAREDDDADA